MPFIPYCRLLLCDTRVCDLWMEINQDDITNTTHYDITMGNDVARDFHCEITTGNVVTRDIHCDVTMSNYVAMWS